MKRQETTGNAASGKCGAAEKHMTESEKSRALSDMLYLSACAIHGTSPLKSRADQMNMENLYRMSRFHALTGIVFEAIVSAYDGKLPDMPLFKKWREDRDKAVTKNLLLDAERAALLAWMEQTGIWYLPLKGSILKDFYPKSGMRQMADNDILFDAAFQEQVKDWFVARGYRVETYRQGVHDCYLKEPVYNFEMHTALFSEDLLPEGRVWADYYQDVKQRLLLDTGKSYGYHFRDEDFYLYITAHACKHYRSSGTGLRTLLDFYVYLSARGSGLNWDYIHTELLKLQLVDFERQTRELAKKTFAKPEEFSVEQLSEEERRMLDCYLFSGTYGTFEQRVKNRVGEMADTGNGMDRGKKIRYAWNRLFPDRVFMEVWCKLYAPVFLKHKWLLPFSVIWRIFRNGFTNTRKGVREIEFLKKTN